MANNDPEQKLRLSLIPFMENVTSQRLTCLLMAFRRRGNVDNLIGEKDMIDASTVGILHV